MWNRRGLRAQNRFALSLELLYTCGMVPEQMGCFGAEEGKILAQGFA